MLNVYAGIECATKIDCKPILGLWRCDIDIHKNVTDHDCLHILIKRAIEDMIITIAVIVQIVTENVLMLNLAKAVNVIDNKTSLK